MKDNTLEQATNIYNEIFTVLDKYKDFIVFDEYSLKERAEQHLFGLELKHVYGYNIDPKGIYSTCYANLSQYIHISKWWDGCGKEISWSNDGRQPQNETLCVVSFPTGAYILGSEYLPELFNEFFVELKSFDPKYADDHNHSLYFTLENGARVYNSLYELIKKYVEKYKKLYAELQIDKLKKQLSDMETQAKRG